MCSYYALGYLHNTHQHTLIAHIYICLGCASCARLFDITVRSCEHICLPFTTHKPHIAASTVWKKILLPSRRVLLSAQCTSRKVTASLSYKKYPAAVTNTHTRTHIYTFTSWMLTYFKYYRKMSHISEELLLFFVCWIFKIDLPTIETDSCLIEYTWMWQRYIICTPKSGKNHDRW